VLNCVKSTDMNPHTKKILTILFFPLLFILHSCQKDSEKTIPDLSNPIIKITNPVNNSSSASQNPITIIGTATDNNLASLDVTVFNVTDTTIIYKNTEAISGAGITINKNYLKFVTSIKTCLLQVIVKDGTGNSTVDSVKFIIY
jgi:hypothetical protein